MEKQKEIINDYCDEARKDLNIFKDRIEKIIAAKKEKQIDANMDNLEEIGAKLSESIAGIGKISQQIRSVLGLSVEAKSIIVDPSEEPSDVSEKK